MSGVRYIVHLSGPFKAGQQHCTRCGASLTGSPLNKQGPWLEGQMVGVRVSDGPPFYGYWLPPGELDPDEQSCEEMCATTAQTEGQGSIGMSKAPFRSSNQHSFASGFVCDTRPRKNDPQKIDAPSKRTAFCDRCNRAICGPAEKIEEHLSGCGGAPKADDDGVSW